MSTSSLMRVAQAVPDATAICMTHDMLLWSSSEYADEVRQQSVYSTARPDPRWSWPNSEELGRCVVAILGNDSVAAGSIESIPALTLQLSHPDPCFRLDAISKLGELEVGAAEAAGAIGAVAGNRDELPLIRQAAMEAASKIWGILSLPAAGPIACVAWDAGEDMALRRFAIAALSAMSTNATTRELEDIALEDTVDVSLRVYAVDMILHAESNNSLDAIDELIEVMGGEIVDRAQRALAGPPVGDACSVYQSALLALEAAAPMDEGGE